MKEEKFKKISKKIIISLTALSIICLYLSVINTIVEAAMLDENQVINQSEQNNQVEQDPTQTKQLHALEEQPQEKEEVHIPDSEFKRYLLANHDIDGDKIITNYDMLQIDNLDISGNYNIKILTGLEVAQNITSLHLRYSYDDISAVNELPKLTNLRLSDDAINTISKLTIMNNLTSLSIYNYNENELDYAYLGTAKKLQSLTIYDNSRKSNIDMNDLIHLTSLQELHITTRVKLDNLESLQHLNVLTSLGIHTGDKLEDISFISKLTGLTYLDLSDNIISNITPLRTLTNLVSIDFYKNPINTKESETAQILQILKDKGVYIKVLEANKTTNIEFKDERFKEILIKNNNVDLNKDNQISIDEMERVDYIYLTSGSDEVISSIAELVYATNLRGLSIYSKIEDMTSIATPSNLKKLTVQDNYLGEENLKTIAGLTELEYLSISVSDNINDLEIFVNMKKLSELNINNGGYVDVNKQKVFDLKGIDKLTNLNKVSISGSVRNINLLEKLPQLQALEISERLYKENGEQLTSKEIVEFLTSLNVKNIKFKTYNSIQVNLPNMLVGSNQKVDLANIGNELIKLVFTPESIFYSENVRISYYEGNVNKTENPITLNTSKLGEEYLYIYINNDKFNCSLSLNWKNYVEGDETKEINIPDENLKAKECIIKGSNNEEEIITAIKNGQNVTLDMKESIENIQAEIFRNLASKDDIDLKVKLVNATWKFNSNDIIDSNLNVNPKVTIANNKFENMDKVPFEYAIYLKFEHEGKLPGKAEIELDVSKNNIYEKGKTVYLYYYDSTKKEYQYLNALTVDDKKITITLEHCSEYVISDKLLETKQEYDNMDNNETTKPDKEPVNSTKENVNTPSDNTSNNENNNIWNNVSDNVSSNESNNNTSNSANNNIANNNQNKPNTGDSSKITLWFLLMIISIAGIVYILIVVLREI